MYIPLKFVSAISLAVILLTGCGGSSETAQSEPAAPTPTPTTPVPPPVSPAPTPTPPAPTPPTPIPTLEAQYYNNGMPVDMKKDVRGLPLLHSLPSAKGQIYLDFDGDFDLGKFHTGVDFDGDPDTYNAQEQEFIYNWWISTAAHFSMFDIDVTTEIDVTRPNSWNAIFPGAKFGVAYGGYGINTNDIAQMTSGHGPYSSVVGHEGGHTLGLPHVVGLSAKGEVTSSYYGSPYPLRGWHLGAGDRIVNKWSNKFRSGAIDKYFGGIEKVTSVIKSADAASTGYRPDEHKADFDSSTEMMRVANTGFSATGVIATMEDTDTFFFDWDGGNASISSHSFELSPVNIRLSLFDGNRQPIALNHNGINHQWISGNLAADRYYVKLQSAKRYSDLGEYRLRVDALPADWRVANIGPKRSIASTSYDNSLKQWALEATGGNISSTQDNFVFIYKKLQGVGSIVAKVNKNKTTNKGSKFGVMIRGGLMANSPHFSQLLQGTDRSDTFYRATAGGGSSSPGRRDEAARWVKIERLESIDNTGNKTGKFNLFKSYVSLDGITWSLIAEQALDILGEAYIGLAKAADSRTQISSALFSSVTVQGNAEHSVNSALAPPTGLVNTAVDHQAISLQWASVSGVTNYIVERSEDGLSFIDIGTVATTTYKDTAVIAGVPYSYRTRAINSKGVSVPSNVLKVQVFPEPPKHLVAIAYDEETTVLDWGEPLGQRGYQIERSTDGINFTVIVAKHSDYASNLAQVSHKDTQKFVDKGLTAGSHYYYRVSTIDENNQVGLPSSVVSAYTRLEKPVLKVTAVDKSKKTASISWNNIANADGFTIERKGSGEDNWKEIATLNASILSYTDDTLEMLDRYSYRIKATSANTDSRWAEVSFDVVNQGLHHRYMEFSGQQEWKTITGNWGTLPGEPEATLKWKSSKNVDYIFHGKNYWRYNPKTQKVSSDAITIKGNWGGVIGNDAYWYNGGLDAAVKLNNDTVYFFKGDRYTTMQTSDEATDNGLAKIADGFGMTGIYQDFASNLDAAVNLSNTKGIGTGKIYFFKGDKFVRYDIVSGKPDLGPLTIKGNWGKADKSIGAAFNDDTSIFLFENH